ncbi:MAG: RNAase [Candidatus Kapaibacterium sp.]|nr:MAG: RNAase [Candidatus Kapabacteria bacterium]
MNTFIHNILNRPALFIKEHTGILKASNHYDVFDADSGEPLLECREEGLGIFVKILRFTGWKTFTPFNCTVRTLGGQRVMSIQRGVSIILSDVAILDENDQLIGFLKQRFTLIRGRFDVVTPDGDVLCELRGNWTSWGYKFLDDDHELASISKRWAGLAKEMFTSADNYVLEISPDVPQNNRIRALMLATVLCVDFVFKERKYAKWLDW